MGIKTPLGRVRGLGSARAGAHHWWLQRLTAMANVPLVIFLVWFVVSMTGAGHAELSNAIGHPVVAIALILGLISLTWHMRLGMQVIIEDYVHGEAVKIALLVANNFYAVVLAAVGIYAVVRTGLPG